MNLTDPPTSLLMGSLVRLERGYWPKRPLEVGSFGPVP